MEEQTDSKVDRQKGRHAGRHADRQADRQKERQKNKRFESKTKRKAATAAHRAERLTDGWDRGPDSYVYKRHWNNLQMLYPGEAREHVDRKIVQFTFRQVSATKIVFNHVHSVPKQRILISIKLFV